jgi:cell division protein FtsN
MLRDGDGEKEILLGNKQLLGIFFLVAILLGLAFGGGYKLGQGSHKSASSTEESSTAAGNSAGGEGRVIGGDATASATPNTGTSITPATDTEPPPGSTETATEQPLGARTKAVDHTPAPQPPAADSEAAGPTPVPHAGFTPQAGQTFLQVAAVGRDEAEAISDVLRKKGFRAHAVPKPGSKLYRVLIGPVRDSSDLGATRNSLRSTGFREIFVQRY